MSSLHESGTQLATPLEGRGSPTLKEEWLTRAYRARIPLTVTLELTQRCNLRCRHCYLGGKTSRELPTSRWVSTIDELAAAGTASVSLTGGEVTLSEGWLDVARAARRHKMMFSVLTSGTLLDERSAAELAELSPVRVSISIYGTTAEAHDAVTGVPGSFERSVDALGALRDLGVSCRVSTVLMDGVGAPGAKAIRSFAEERGCDYGCSPLVYPAADGSSEPLRLRLGATEYRAFVEQNLDMLPEHQRMLEGPDGVELRSAANCRAGLMGAFIQADGDVLPCFGWRPPFGNIADTPFDRVWWSEAAARHRERMLAPLTACAQCDISGLCFLRCPKLCEMEAGDMSGVCPPACAAAGVIRDMRRERADGASDSTMRQREVIGID